MKIYLDSETCGFHGVCVLIQYAEEDGPTILHSCWTTPVSETLKLIEHFCQHTVIGFNLTFDWFHMNKIYNMFVRFADAKGYDKYPVDHIEYIASIEKSCRDGFCLKPKSAFDIMLHARKGPYQSTMDRSDIKIRRVPVQLAFRLCNELNKRIRLNDIYFARRKDKFAEQWKVYETDEKDDFRNVVLKFAPSSGLKALAVDALKLKNVLRFDEISLGEGAFPNEVGWAPFHEAVKTGGWPYMLMRHISHWAYNDIARKYAYEDVDRYTRPLYKYFGSPETGDNDSILACMVGAVRWKGFKINLDGMKDLRKKALVVSKSAPKAPAQARKWLFEVMDEIEQTVLTSTKKTVLEEVARFDDSEAAERAQAILDARAAGKEVELYDKLTQAGRFHASFKVIGTLSSRMAGADGLNPQGIKRTKEVRSQFPLAPDDMILYGGDFAGFEVCLADAAYNDPKLREDLQRKVKCADCNGSGLDKGKECKDCKGTGMCGMKIHALFGESLFPEEDYDSIIASKGTDDDKYDKSKRSVFALLYGGDENTINHRIGIDLEDAKTGCDRFMQRYPGVEKARKKTFDKFCSMRQPGGIGTAVEWHEPSDYIESLLGFRRYFTLENKICKTLFDLANDPPAEWKDLKIKVRRRDRDQTGAGAVMSALYGAAFAIQAANMRAAANHEIQSTGAEITKDLECQLWALQPTGVSRWMIMPMNVHDEVMSPAKSEMKAQIFKVVDFIIAKYKKIVPLIAIDFGQLESWAEK